MGNPTIAPYGSWKSPITSDLIVAETIGLGGVWVESGDTYWLEMRPRESGRYVLVRRGADGGTLDVTPEPFNVRTRVHEYGGGSVVINGGTVWFSNFNDQRLYRQDLREGGRTLHPISPAAELRYADGIYDPIRDTIICVREDHTRGEGRVVNTIVAVDAGGEGSQRVLVKGNDFYSNPRLSPDRSCLAWLTWNHPNMPWDGTELWVARIAAEGTLGSVHRVAGGDDESICQPEWSPDDHLYFVSDRSGWWNIYRQVGAAAVPVCPREAEFGRPQWTFGLSAYAFGGPDRIICTYSEHGIGRLAWLTPSTGQLEPIDLAYTEIYDLRASRGRVVFIGASPNECDAVVTMEAASGRVEVIRRSNEAASEPALRAYFSQPEPIEFPSSGGLTAHGLFYPPANPDYLAPRGEKPPLLVKSHGGPTAAALSLLDLLIQFWTSRGVAVLDVNYSGSSGYGRDYRNRLRGQWGIVDVDDCINGAKSLAQADRIDPMRTMISGGSAGGYTTLCALTFRDFFKAGGSYYGVSDLEALANDTHKFESRYLDRLIAPYPERRDLYLARSPISHTDRLSAPVIFFQGDEDRIVPPDQTEKMVDAIRAKGLPVAYLLFAGEQHGFRRAENIKRALDAELYFYSALVLRAGLRF
jgi:dipeptidyl aminopeptidase/acylaminoacyl peptidase